MSVQVAEDGGARRCPECGEVAARTESRFCRACGAPLAPPASPEGPARPARRRLRRRALIPVGVVVVTLVVLLGGSRLTQSLAPPPQQPVEELLAAIADREGDRVAELLNLSEEPLVTDLALGSGYTPPTDMVVTGVRYGEADEYTKRPDRRHARVAVRYRVDGEAHTTVVNVVRADSGWVRPWTLADDTRFAFPGSIEVTSAHYDTVSVSGRELPANASIFNLTSRGVAALPGSYTVHALGDNPLFEAEPVRAVVLSGALVEVSADEVRVRPGLVEQVEEQVGAHLAECAENTVSLNPPACPLRVDRDGFFAIENVRWTIVQEPRIRVFAAGNNAVHGDPITVETVEPGTATVEFSYANLSDGPEERTVDIVVGGSVRVEDGRAVWE